MVQFKLNPRQTTPHWIVRLARGGSQHGRESTGGGGVPIDALPMTYGQPKNFHTVIGR